MSDLQTLQQLDHVRTLRVEVARKEVAMAGVRLEEASKRQTQTLQTLQEYIAQIDKMVDDLYTTCIGQKVGREFVEEIRQKELKIYAREAELKQDHQKALEAVEHAKTALASAKGVLLAQITKQEALSEVIDAEQEAVNKDLAKGEQKKMDEIASCKKM